MKLLLGGTVMDAKENLVGIISYCYENNDDVVYEFIPSLTILKFLTNKSIYNLPINFENNNITFDNVKNNYTTDAKIKWKFNKGDEIKKINDMEINEEKTNIFLKKLNKYVPIDTYLAYTPLEYLKITIKRNNILHELKIKNKESSQLYCIPLYNMNANIINFHNLLFVEATCEIMVRLTMLGYDIKCNEVNNKINELTSNNKYTSKCILLLRISNDFKNNTESKIVSQPIFGLLDEDNKTLQILVLKSINDYEIKNLNNIKKNEEIQNKKKIIVKMTNDYTITILNNKITISKQYL